MKKLVCVLLFAFSAVAAQADTLTCTLSSGSKSTKTVLKLDAIPEDGVGSAGVYDLSYYLELSCDAAKCEGGVTFNSGMAEDEVGQTGFEFARDKRSRTVIDEPLEGAPDGRDYRFVCKYTK